MSWVWCEVAVEYGCVHRMLFSVVIITGLACRGGMEKTFLSDCTVQKNVDSLTTKPYFIKKNKEFIFLY